MGKPYVVGIAGGTCSGKTTAVVRLAQLFEAETTAVFNMDRYFKRPAIMTVAPITGIEYPEHNHPDSMELENLYRDFDAACDGESGFNLVIIEGLFALYLPRIREKLDLKVFVDLKSDERLVRRIRRFKKADQPIESVTDRYLDTVRFRHDELIEPTRWHADIVLNGTLDSHIGLKLLESFIRRNLPAAAAGTDRHE